LGVIRVSIPVAHLLDRRLTEGNKLVWMVMRLDRLDKSLSVDDLYSSARLAKRTGLTQRSIQKSMHRLEETSWFVRYGRDGKPYTRINRPLHPDSWVSMPAELLTSKLMPSNIVIYGLLQDEYYCRNMKGMLTYRSLADYSGMSVKTVRLAINTLKEHYWLKIWQEKDNQIAPYHYELGIASISYTKKQIDVTNMRLSREGGHGEAIAMAMVQLVIQPSECLANCRPDWLVNPETNELMELDIWFPAYKLAVEFNGPQHYQATPFASAEEVARQQKRDALKARILRKKGINLVVLTAEDLAVDVVVKKLQGLAPLRDLYWYRQLVEYLNYVGSCYRDRRYHELYENREPAASPFDNSPSGQ